MGRFGKAKSEKRTRECAPEEALGGAVLQISPQHVRGLRRGLEPEAVFPAKAQRLLLEEEAPHCAAAGAVEALREASRGFVVEGGIGADAGEGCDVDCGELCVHLHNPPLEGGGGCEGEEGLQRAPGARGGAGLGLLDFVPVVGPDPREKLILSD